MSATHEVVRRDTLAGLRAEVERLTEALASIAARGDTWENNKGGIVKDPKRQWRILAALAREALRGNGT